MISLTGGNIQDGSGNPVAYGSISFQLNLDARVVASPYGQVSSKIVTTFQLDANGDLITPCKIWANKELNPQLSPTLLGTYYLVCIYSQSGARISGPMWWIFPNSDGDTVNISQMIAVEFTNGGD